MTGTAGTALSGRARSRNVKPYSAPESVEQPRGPYHSRIALSHWGRWQMDHDAVEVDGLGGHHMAYLGTVANTDLGVGRRSRPPVLLDIGPVLDAEDAAESKVAALFLRGTGLPRD